jgi:hypothetical protein
MDNIYVPTDPSGNIKPDTEKSTEKIDGAVATVMALDRAIRSGNSNAASVYNERGIMLFEHKRYLFAPIIFYLLAFHTFLNIIEKKMQGRHGYGAGNI